MHGPCQLRRLFASRYNAVTYENWSENGDFAVRYQIEGAPVAIP